jgi:hypothetical protein
MGYTARVGEMRNIYKSLIGKPEGKGHSEDLDVDRRMILSWNLGKQGTKTWI